MHCKKIIFVILNLVLYANLNAQPLTEWAKRYQDPTNHNVYFVDMVKDKEDNVIITGYIYIDANNRDILTLKYDSQGALKWVKTYDSPVHRYDIPNKIAVDNS
ncbi:MAG TPA: hypothetical protein VIK14_01060 [Ignavibacteria bacterium]